MSLFLTHFFAQVGSALQPHLISSLQPTAAAGRVVQTGRHPVSIQSLQGWLQL